MTAPRAWTLGPMTGRTLNANGRPHWTYRRAVTREWRDDACQLAKAAKVPRLDRARIRVDVLPHRAGRYDPNNVAPMSKAIVDGLVDAGVLDDDDATRLDGPDHRPGPITRPDGPALLWRNTTTLLVTILEAA